MATDIESAIYSHLTGTTDLVSQVSTRIYPNRAPQDAARPFISYRRISTTNQHDLGGALGMTRPTFEFTVVGGRDASNYQISYSTVKTISNLLRTHLDGYQGLLQSVGVRSITHINTSDDYIAPADGDDKGTHLVESDYQVWLTESIPNFS